MANMIAHCGGNIQDTRSTVIAIIGPTATGKTAVGIRLAEMIGGEIISVDSMAVYKGMDIGTAKPSPTERMMVPFHLIDVVCPDEEFSVAEFKRLADVAITDIVSRGKEPLLVGGTGLYVKALAGGLNVPLAGPDQELRESLRSEAAEFGNKHLLERLRVVDQITAERLHENDLNRIIRALEVHTLTGIPISHFHSTAGTSESAYCIRLFGLTMSREAIYKRIEQRIDEQIASGFVDEVKGLLDKGYSVDLPSMKGLGYKQIAGYFAGEYDLQTGIDLMKRDTRRFAKRQFTWYRAVPGVHWIDVEGRSADQVAEEIARG